MDFACITIFVQIRGSSISEATFCLCDTYLLLWPGPVGHNQPATNYVPLIADSKPLTTATKLLAHLQVDSYLFGNAINLMQVFSGNFKYPLQGKIPHPLSFYPIFSTLLQISAARSYLFLVLSFSSLTISEHGQHTLAWRE